MINLDNIQNETIIICEKETKKQILKQLTKEKKLLNIKILTKKELIKKLYFSYDLNAILYLIEKYNYKYEVATMYLDNLIYIEDKTYKNDKLKHLQVLKNELEEQKLLLKDNNFQNLIEGKDIIFYHYDYLTSFDKKIINDLKEISNVKIIDKDYKNYQPKIYELKTIDEEIEFVADEISKLIENNIEVNNIKLTNLDDSYLKKLEMTFALYNLPLEPLTKTSIYETEIGQTFIKNYQEDIEKTIDLLNKKYKDKDTINKIINILNKYIKINNFTRVKQLIIHDLKTTYIKQPKLKNQIEVINYNNQTEDTNYVFMLNFNQKSIPNLKKDEDFLTDNLKEELNLNTTLELNKMIKQSTIKNIQNIKNLTITYKTQDGKQECYPSALKEELNIETQKPNKDIKISYSTINNKLKLAKKLDNYTKYNTVDEKLKILNNNYEIPYQKYDNNYTGIDTKEMYDFLEGKLNLSYTKMDTYNKCAFAYYIANILKLDPYEKNISAKFGSIFHYCLEKGLKQEIDINTTVDNYIKENNYEFTNKEQHFIEKLKQEINFALKTIKEQTKYQSLNNILTEQEVTIEKNKNLKVTFKGIIDKILYNEENEVAIIDYKTGNTDIKLDLVDYGLSMQLPVYLYLANNLEKIKNPTFAGFYLQQVLHPEIIRKNNKTYEEQKLDNLKLNGYSNEDKNIIEKLDNTYENSKLIKGLKIAKTGNFDFRSKTITNEQIKELITKTDQIIDKTINQIEGANFEINPKIINGINKSCEYCKYKDLCFKTPKNNIYIKIEKEEENELDS